VEINANQSAYLEDILVLRRLRERAFCDLACDLEELAGLSVTFAG
jgi:hypothetical protein